MNILLNDYTEMYENIITIEDFKMTVDNPQLNGFTELQDMYYLNNDPTCTDNILASRKIMFNTSKTFENDLSDHHKLVSIIMKSGSFRDSPKYKLYRSYKNFDLECVNIVIKAKLNSIKGPTYNQFG